MDMCQIFRCGMKADWHIWNPLSGFDSFICEIHMTKNQWKQVHEGRQGIESITFYKKKLREAKK